MESKADTAKRIMSALREHDNDYDALEAIIEILEEVGNQA